jgi:hypothetical protein
VELNFPRGFCEESVVSAEPDIETGMNLGSALPHDDRSGANLLAAKGFDSESL